MRRLNNATVRVTWQAVQTAANLTGYTVFYSQVPTSRRRQVTAEMNRTFSSSAASGTISGLEASKTYQFQVSAFVNVNGEELVGDRSEVNDNSRVDLEGEVWVQGAGAGTVVGQGQGLGWGREWGWCHLFFPSLPFLPMCSKS